MKSFAKCKVAFDLGTQDSKIIVGDKLNIEPTVVTLTGDKGKLLAFGDEAYRMIGRNHDALDVHMPMCAGAISEFLSIRQYIKAMLSKHSDSHVMRTMVYTAVPKHTTNIEKKSILEAFIGAGALELTTFDSVICSAIGMEIDVLEPRGRMILDLGAGITELAVVSLGGIVESESVKYGGVDLTRALIENISKKMHLKIGFQTAENLKKNVINGNFVVNGIDTLTGLPIECEVDEDIVCDQFDSYYKNLLSYVVTLFSRIPPELVSDIADDGIFLAGGASRFGFVAERLENDLKIKVNCMDIAEKASVVGLAKIMKDDALAKRLAVKNRKNDR